MPNKSDRTNSFKKALKKSLGRVLLIFALNAAIIAVCAVFAGDLSAARSWNFLVFVIILCAAGFFAAAGWIVSSAAARMAAESASERKSFYLKSVGGEIRGTVNTIIASCDKVSAELQGGEVNTGRCLDELNSVKFAGAGLVASVFDILDYSDMLQNKISFEKTSYQTVSLLNDVVNIVGAWRGSREIKFLAAFDPRIPDELVGDIIRFRQICLNLLGAALADRAEGVLKFSVNCELLPENRARIGIMVEESLCGGRGDARDTELGITIARMLCEGLEGGLEIAETDGGRRMAACIIQEYRNERGIAVVDEKKKVLVFEPDDIFRAAVCEALAWLGAESFAAAGEQEYRDMAERLSPDYIFAAGECIGALAADKALPSGVVVVEMSDAEKYPPDFPAVRCVQRPVTVISAANLLNEKIVLGDAAEEIELFDAAGTKVLIVDDILINLMVAEGMMAGHGMETDICESGFDAIDMVKNNEYDLIFMDHMMPGLDGIETAHRIREIDGEYYKNVPIIALTANANADMEFVFKDNGMNGMLAKPIDAANLNAVLARWLKK